MAKQYKNQWVVESSSSRGHYTISENLDGTFECSCRGWTGHYPRTDCKHIREVHAGGGKSFGETTIDILS